MKFKQKKRFRLQKNKSKKNDIILFRDSNNRLQESVKRSSSFFLVLNIEQWRLIIHEKEREKVNKILRLLRAELSLLCQERKLSIIEMLRW